MPVAGLIPTSPKKKPVPPTPTLLPKKKREERRVFLEPEAWKALDEVARFHSEVFEAMGADEKVSRNDIIAAFLDWAVNSYWEDKGGKPDSSKDWLAKVREYAQRLKTEATPK